MSAYFVVNIEVTDAKGFEDYRQQVVEVLEAYDGKYLVRGGKFEVLEGQWNPNLMVVVEFPSMERALEFYHSERYAPLLKLRLDSTNSDLVLVDGT